MTDQDPQLSPLVDRRKNLLMNAREILNQLQATYPTYEETYNRIDDLIREIEDMLGIRQ